MTTFYIEKENKIVMHDTNKNRLVTTLKFTPQFAGLEIKETERPIEKCEWADTEEYIAKKQRTELESQVAQKEAQTGLIRPIREMILAENSGASEYAKSKARELEELAEQLRG